MEFINACDSGDFGAVQKLLSTSDPEIDEHMVYAFTAACEKGHLEIVQLLLGQDGDRRITGKTLRNEGIIGACYSGNVRLVELLLSLKEDRKIDIHSNNEVMYRLACLRGNTELVEYFLKLEGDQRIDTHALDDEGFVSACRREKWDVVKIILCSGVDRLPPKAVFEKHYRGRLTWGDVVWANRMSARIVREGHTTYIWAHGDASESAPSILREIKTKTHLPVEKIF